MQYCDLINLLALQFHDIHIFLTLILDRLKVHMVNRETMNKRTTEGELAWVLGVLYHPQNLRIVYVLAPTKFGELLTVALTKFVT